MLALPLAAASDPVAAGWDHFYNLEYAAAMRAFEQAVDAEPGNAAYHNYLAQAALYSELYRLGALESELLTGNNHFIRTEKIRPEAEQSARFLREIGRAMELAQAGLASNPGDQEALYALGSAYALRTNYHFLVEKAWRPAMSDGSLARKHHNQVVELNPQHYDAMLTQAAYDYVIGSLPWHTRMVSFLMGRTGDKNNGIRTMKLIAEKGTRNKADAQVMLAIIHRREKQPAEAIRVLDPLIRAYPRNYLFRMEKAHMFSDLGKKDEALGCLREVEQMPGAPLEKVHYAIGNVQFWYNDLEAALSNMRRVTQSSNLDLHTGVLAWMRTGQILDITGRRREALESYRRAIRFAPQTAAAAESKRYLSSPYRRKG